MILFHKETDAGQAVDIRDLKQTTTGVATGTPSNQKVESFAVDSILCRRKLRILENVNNSD